MQPSHALSFRRSGHASQRRSCPSPSISISSVRTPPHRASGEAVLPAEPRSITSVINPRSAGGPHDFSSEGGLLVARSGQSQRPLHPADGLTNPDNFVAHRQLLLGFARDFGAFGRRLPPERKKNASRSRPSGSRMPGCRTGYANEPQPPLFAGDQGRSTGRSIGVIDTLHLARWRSASRRCAVPRH